MFVASKKIKMFDYIKDTIYWSTDKKTAFFYNFNRYSRDKKLENGWSFKCYYVLSNGKRCQTVLNVIYDDEEEKHKVTKINKITHNHPETSSCEMTYEIESTKIKESFLVLNENVVSIDNSKKKTSMGML